MLPEDIKKHLKSKNINVVVLEKCASTNTVAREYAEAGADDLTVIIANEQSEGRGRLGRSFFSPGNTGLYMSVILRKKIKAVSALEITTAAAVAAARVIKRVTDADIKIKWVNDIYADMKKVCGILTESSVDTESGYLNYAVLGIGVNLFMPEGGFPDDIRGIAASVFDTVSDREKKAVFTAALIDEFVSLYPHIGENSFVGEYRCLSLMPEREIYVLSGDEKIPATAISIGDDYSLNVRYADGSTASLSSGDVSIKVR